MKITNITLDKEEPGLATVTVESQDVLDMGDTKFMEACCRVSSPFITGTDKHDAGFVFYFDMTEYADDYETTEDLDDAMKLYIDDSVDAFDLAIYEEKIENSFVQRNNVGQTSFNYQI